MLTKIVNGKIVELTPQEVADFDQREIAHQQKLADALKTKYQRDRAENYPSIVDQLDLLHSDLKNGTQVWVDTIQTIKDQFPKPPEEK